MQSVMEKWSRVERTDAVLGDPTHNLAPCTNRALVCFSFLFSSLGVTSDPLGS